MDPDTMEQVPADGETIGEVMFRGNIVMKGYLKNQKATKEAFAGGWFHSGDLGVIAPRRLHPAQGPLEGHHHLRRREHFLHRGRGRALQAPARSPPLPWWRSPTTNGARRPCAFIEKKPGAEVTEAEIIGYCKNKLARFKCPSRVVFVDLPKTSTGKIQKFKLRELAKTA